MIYFYEFENKIKINFLLQYSKVCVEKQRRVEIFY